MNSYWNGEREATAIDEQIAKIDAELTEGQPDTAPAVDRG